MATVDGNLMVELAESSPLTGNKVTIVGVGQVGMACAFSILTQNVSYEICLIDIDENRALGEMMDLQHGSNFLRNPKITAGSDYALSAKSRVCIVTAGVRRNQVESVETFVQKNSEILKSVIPKLIEHSPDAILLIVTNPVDIMTYVAWKLSGLPKNRVFGSGTNLDSSRLRFLMSQQLTVGPNSCHGWVIGEHGDNSVPIWSGVNIAGVSLRDINPEIGMVDTANEESCHCGESEDLLQWNSMHREVVESAYQVVRLKGYTSWAIGLSVASLTSNILKNTNNVVAVSTYAKGHHGIDKEIFLSLPCVLNANGVTSIVEQILTPQETQQLQKVANLLADIQGGINLQCPLEECP